MGLCADLLTAAGGGTGAFFAFFGRRLPSLDLARASDSKGIRGRHPLNTGGKGPRKGHSGFQQPVVMPALTSPVEPSIAHFQQQYLHLRALLEKSKQASLQAVERLSAVVSDPSPGPFPSAEGCLPLMPLLN